jgi:hypothetical protein
MLTNELLEAKYRFQRALADQVGDDLREYAQNVHRIVREVERKQRLKFRYRRAGKKTAADANA